MTKALLIVLSILTFSSPAFATDDIDKLKQDVKYLYIDLMELIESDVLMEYGYSQNSPGGEWIKRYEELEGKFSEKSIYFPYGKKHTEYLILGQLWQLGRSTFSSPSKSKTKYLTLESAKWAKAIICIDYPQICEPSSKKRSTALSIKDTYNKTIEFYSQPGYLEDKNKFLIGELRKHEGFSSGFEYNFNNEITLSIYTDKNDLVSSVAMLAKFGDNPNGNISLGFEIAKMIVSSYSPKLEEERFNRYFSSIAEKLKSSEETHDKEMIANDLRYRASYAKNLGFYFSADFE